MAPFFDDGVSQFTERVTDSSVALGRTGALNVLPLVHLFSIIHINSYMDEA